MDPNLPAYGYVPGGPWPHPRRAGPDAGAFAIDETLPPPVVGDAWADSPAYLRGFDLFGAGYYWEAHEVWEGLWHAHGRHGPIADLLKALIKLAAAGVKVRERQPRGASTHADRARDVFQGVRAAVGARFLGLDLDTCAALAAAVAASPPDDPAAPGAAVSRVFAFEIRPGP
jgi:hypothetical protein